jgi:hypothetical protein
MCLYIEERHGRVNREKSREKVPLSLEQIRQHFFRQTINLFCFGKITILFRQNFAKISAK